MFFCHLCITCFIIIKKNMKYFLSIFFIFVIVKETILQPSTSIVFSYTNIVNGVYNLFSINFCSYIGYFVLGYYISLIDTKKIKKSCLIFVWFIICMLSSLCTYLAASYYNSSLTFFYGNFSINVFIESILLFILFKNLKIKPNHEKVQNVTIEISGLTLGVYLIHEFVIEILDEFLGLTTLSFNAFISIPLITIICFLISLILVFVLKGLFSCIKKYNKKHYKKLTI